MAVHERGALMVVREESAPLEAAPMSGSCGKSAFLTCRSDKIEDVVAGFLSLGRGRDDSAAVGPQYPDPVIEIGGVVLDVIGTETESAAEESCSELSDQFFASIGLSLAAEVAGQAVLGA